MRDFKQWMALALVWAGIFAAMAATAKSDDAIAGPEKVGIGELVVLEAKLPAKAFAWEASHEGRNWTTFDGGMKLVFATGKPGTYTFFMAPAGDKPAIHKKTVVVEGVVPNPPHPPTPAPKPQPTPGAKLWVMFVYESSKPDKATGLTLGDPSMIRYLSSKHHWCPIDKDRVDPADAGRAADWVSLVGSRAKPLPCLIITTEAGGEPLYFDQAPATAAGVLDLVKQYGG